MTFEKWIKEKYKGKSTNFKVNPRLEYLEYFQCCHDEAIDNFWWNSIVKK